MCQQTADKNVNKQLKMEYLDKKSPFEAVSNNSVGRPIFCFIFSRFFMIFSYTKVLVSILWINKQLWLIVSQFF